MGFPGFTAVPHPGPLKRLGNAKSSLLLVLAGSPPVPYVGVKGTPSLAVNMMPSSHPLASQCAGPVQDLGEGMSHVPFTTKVRPTLKSDSPRVNFVSNQSRLEIEFPNASPATVAELVSMLLPQVNVPCT